MTDMNINPEELINNLSQQIGALMAENTALKMAVSKTQEALQSAQATIASLQPAEAESADTGDQKKKK